MDEPKPSVFNKMYQVRSMINEDLVISGGNLSLRGNERVRADAKTLKIRTAGGAGFRLKTSSDGSIRLGAKRIFFGKKVASKRNGNNFE